MTQKVTRTAFSHPTPELPVESVERAQAHYRDALGFEIGWLYPGGDIGAVSRDDVAIFLRRRPMPFEPAVHWVFAEDIDATFEELNSRGARIVEPLEDKPWGLRQFTVEDIDGNRFYFHGDRAGGAQRAGAPDGPPSGAANHPHGANALSAPTDDVAPARAVREVPSVSNRESLTCIAVDWSGAEKPVRKIWLAEADGDGLHRLEAFSSREAVIDAVLEYARTRERVVAGFDFAFSLPAWFQDEHGLVDGPSLWSAVRDRGEDWLRDCAPPFWGRPGRRRPELPAHLRATEERVGRLASIKPKSGFQIGGAGAVGTGSLRGMPYLQTLRERGWSIWPFDSPGCHTVVEIYPRALTGAVTKSQPEARRAYVLRTKWSWTDTHRRDVESSEDAFDAAISALVMAEHAGTLNALPIRAGTAAREGEIWVPPSHGTRL
ncbi:MAG: VOC family protein [Vicinamibacterales bacterium]